ncbi:hypothetical protein MTO96_036602 [Rhipicephalus appendiculatus]
MLVTCSKPALSVVGRAAVVVEFKRRKAKLPLLVAKRRYNNLLGWNWFRPLDIGQYGTQQLHVEDMTSRSSQVSCSDYHCFNGPPVHIELKDDAEPTFLRSRPVPLALKTAWPRKWTAWCNKESGNQSSTPTGQLRW